MHSPKKSEKFIAINLVFFSTFPPVQFPYYSKIGKIIGKVLLLEYFANFSAMLSNFPSINWQTQRFPQV